MEAAKLARIIRKAHLEALSSAHLVPGIVNAYAAATGPHLTDFQLARTLVAQLEHRGNRRGVGHAAAVDGFFLNGQPLGVGLRRGHGQQCCQQYLLVHADSKGLKGQFLI